MSDIDETAADRIIAVLSEIRNIIFGGSHSLGILGPSTVERVLGAANIERLENHFTLLNTEASDLKQRDNKVKSLLDHPAVRAGKFAIELRDTDKPSHVWQIRIRAGAIQQRPQIENSKSFWRWKFDPIGLHQLDADGQLVLNQEDDF